MRTSYSRSKPSSKTEKRSDQLPSERELTEIFKVSRTTVREAIRTLESMKLLQCRQGDGMYVIATSEEALIQPLAAALFNANDDIRDIFYIRKIIEPHIAHLAAENATPQEIEEMAKILHEQAVCIGRGESVLETDTLFHSRKGMVCVPVSYSLIVFWINHVDKSVCRTQMLLTAHMEEKGDGERFARIDRRGFQR